MPRLAALARITRVASLTASGGLLLAACAQGETLDGFGGSDFTSGSGGSVGTTTGKATGSTANASTNAVVSSTAVTKATSASVSATTNATNNTVATTAAPAATTAAVTSGGPMACFDVCTAGAAPDPLACFGDAGALACIAGICIADPDCCDVAWDDQCALAGTLAAIAGACSC